MTSEIKIYVACLASYNNAILHGCWIDATQDMDDIWDDVNQMLKDSPEENAEEYAIHDYEGFGSYQVSEYEGLESANQAALFIEEHGDIAGDLLTHFGDDIDDATNKNDERDK